MAGFKMVYTTSPKLDSIPISPGQLLFCEDNRSILFDNEDSVRINYSLVVDLETEAQRQALSSPYNAIYFVEETLVLWKYVLGTWVQLTEEPEQQIVFYDSVEELPDTGNSRRIYVVGTDQYRYLDGNYEIMGSQQNWGSF